MNRMTAMPAISHTLITVAVPRDHARPGAFRDLHCERIRLDDVVARPTAVLLHGGPGSFPILCRF
jgi:hypothetical protein